MPRSRRLAPEVVRARLTVASDRLRQSGDEDLAEAIDAVTAPRGWELLKKPVKETAADPNMALWMNKTIKDAILAASRVAGDSLPDVVDQGFRAFIAGDFVPAKPLRSARGSATPKDNLNVRPSKTLRDQVEALCPAKSTELGWQVTPGLVAAAWLYEEYGITDDDQRGVTAPAMPDQE
ncbi:hypothetical protein [Streptomyces sp. NBRC 110035]|uniref:hypothetical protein n=1 Tax=Streptomyces sp. NBRC 110035 TaxID=1547867 RepID=UPI0005A72561|nr:hypothetical protein [Streptomyces sp. NBRC 110035]